MSLEVASFLGRKEWPFSTAAVQALQREVAESDLRFRAPCYPSAFLASLGRRWRTPALMGQCPVGEVFRICHRYSNSSPAIGTWIRSFFRSSMLIVCRALARTAMEDAGWAGGNFLRSLDRPRDSPTFPEHRPASVHSHGIAASLHLPPLAP